jgi:hypothetical protein
MKHYVSTLIQQAVEKRPSGHSVGTIHFSGGKKACGHVDGLGFQRKCEGNECALGTMASCA